MLIDVFDAVLTFGFYSSLCEFWTINFRVGFLIRHEEIFFL